MAKIIDGKSLALKIEREIFLKFKNSRKKITLAIVKVANSRESSNSYCLTQEKLAAKFGYSVFPVQYASNISKQTLIKAILKLNRNPQITGMLLQLPLPKTIDPQEIISHIDPRKDAEGIHPNNLGKLFFDGNGVIPPTPAAVMHLLKSLNLSLYGKEVVIVGHSEIVGKPLSLLLLKEFSTVTVCHIATYKKNNLKVHTKRADILIVACGQPEMITGEYIKKGCIIVDIGINYVNSILKGDVNFQSAIKKASYITPVPGGVGPLTNVMLAKNLLKLAEIRI